MYLSLLFLDTSIFFVLEFGPFGMAMSIVSIFSFGVKCSSSIWEILATVQKTSEPDLIVHTIKCLRAKQQKSKGGLVKRKQVLPSGFASFIVRSLLLDDMILHNYVQKDETDGSSGLK